MIKYLVQISVCLFFAACNQKQEQPAWQIAYNKDSIKQEIPFPKQSQINERFIPKEKEISQTDTIVTELALQISVIRTALDSFVVQEYESNGTRYIYKYRNYENNLVIKKGGEVILDSTFTKNDFSKFTGQEFLRTAIFHGYWFKKIDNNTVVLFGTIDKPDTDWSFAFYHNYNLTTQEFEVLEHIDQDI
ncbi:DUF4738 domain-containing protein [Fulvivirga ulvae]|uniref:DUF4738 domain-containing protein n=1 Tax=Fulvivirga ulvae TaxID=2904245 RepID=UPI001F38B32A|nr:DUF4738 domain-containing protein [Fulvivirga ulvae]UII32747.1 DUF4738 domain-containing protein [Fulvivirga ulvae]